MAKRRLSKQQHRRIARRQQQRREAPGQQDPAVSNRRHEGRVITRYGKQADVVPLAEANEDPGEMVRCHIRANAGDIVTGDLVVYLNTGMETVIESVLPRRTLLIRPDTRGQPRPVAANVDRIGIVLAPTPEPHANLIDRYLVAAETLGLTPLLVLNKADLPDPGDRATGLLAIYRKLGYETLSISAARGTGMETLTETLRHGTTVFVGQSGVGKSSLVNRVCPAAGAAVGDLSMHTRGRHTTTSATFYTLPGGGSLIDSPGIRSFGLWHLAPEEVARGFVEFRPWLGQCRFRNCRHFEEPGCAVREASRSGVIDQARLDSYRQIVNDTTLR